MGTLSGGTLSGGGGSVEKLVEGGGSEGKLGGGGGSVGKLKPLQVTGNGNEPVVCVEELAAGSKILGVIVAGPAKCTEGCGNVTALVHTGTRYEGVIP